MAAATVETIIETGCSGIEIVRLEMADEETYQSRKLKYINGALLGINRDENVTTNVEDDDSSAINGLKDGVILNAAGLTANSTVTLVLIGGVDVATKP